MNKILVLFFALVFFSLAFVSNVSAKDFVIHNATDESQEYFVTNGTTGNINVLYNVTASWFKGIFNWVIGSGSDYLSFNGTTLNFSETKLNATIGVFNDSMKTYVDSQDTTYNNSMKTYTDALDTATNTTMKTYVDSQNIIFNDSMKTYVDSQDTIFNNSMKTYVDALDTATNTTATNWVDALFVRFTELVGQIGNWSLDKTNYYNKTEVTANITSANTSMKTYVDALDTATNTTMKTYVDSQDTSFNNSMKTYVDSQDTSANTSVVNWAEDKFVVNSGGDSLSGQYDFNGGWTASGLSIIDGDIYAQTGWFYNITALGVNTLRINGSLIPQAGFDNQFDVGNATLRWRDLYLGRNANVSGNLTVDNNVLFVNSVSDNVGIGTMSPTAKLTIIATATGLNVSTSGVIENDAIFQTISNNDFNLRLGKNNTLIGQIIAGTDRITLAAINNNGVAIVDDSGNGIFVKDGGNVGIGTTAPGVGLQVGNTASSQSLTATNDVMIGGKLEVNDRIYCDLAATDAIWLPSTSSGIKISTNSPLTLTRDGISKSGGTLTMIAYGGTLLAAVNGAFTGSADMASTGGDDSSAYVRLYGGLSTLTTAEGGPVGFFGGYNSKDNGRYAPVIIGSRVDVDPTKYATAFTNQADPVFAVFSHTDPDTATDEHIYLKHDATDGTIATGKGNLILSPASGNIGIGTTSPTHPLEVVKTTGTSEVQIISRDTYAYVGLEGGAVGDVGWALMSGYPNAGDFNIRQGGVGNFLTIKKTTGNVGIGTTSPLDILHISKADTARLLIQENTGGAGDTAGIYFKTSADVSDAYFKGGIIFEDDGGAGATGKLHLATYSGTGAFNAGVSNARLTIDKDGNVGIGTTSPGEELQISSATPELRFNDTDNKYYFDVGQSGTYFKVSPNDTASTGLFVDGAGNVGIGTTAPTAKVHIVDGAGVLPSWSSSTILAIQRNDIVTRGAGLGIIAGTTGLSYIDFGDADDRNIGNIIYNHSDNKFTFTTNAIENQMVIDSSGNVGIGTASPDYKLQVNGSIAPETNNTFDLGKSTLAWANVYAVTYNDLTPAWTSSDGSALTTLTSITSTDGEINHTSLSKKLRNKFYVVPVTEEKCEQIIEGYEMVNIPTNVSEEVCEIINDQVGLEETEICEEVITLKDVETNQTIYGQNCWTETKQQSIQVDEDLSDLEQLDSVTNELNVSKEEIKVQYTRDLGATITALVQAVKELFDWNTQQDLEIANLKNENQLLKTELCKKDNSYIFCKTPIIK